MKKLILPFLLFSTFVIGGLTLNNKSTTFNSVYAEETVLAESSNITVDEFIALWKEFRKDYPNICDLPKEIFEPIFAAYETLSESDKKIVDATPDVDGYTIGDSMKTLINKYRNIETHSTVVLNKGNTLIIVIVLAVFGMSAICGFFLLKNKNIIE